MAATSERRTLRSVLKETGPIAFDPKPQYFDRGDYLVYVFNDDDWYTERIDDTLTVYRSKSTHELTGCKIKGVSVLAENAKNIVKVEEDDIELRFILLGASGAGGRTRELYYDLSTKCEHVTVPLGAILKRAA